MIKPYGAWALVGYASLVGWGHGLMFDLVVPPLRFPRLFLAWVRLSPLRRGPAIWYGSPAPSRNAGPDLPSRLALPPGRERAPSGGVHKALRVWSLIGLLVPHDVALAK